MPETGAPATPPGPRPPAPNLTRAASRLGPYTIEALLGRGGMSAVYRAMQTTLDRPVALKLLPSEFAGDPTFVARFLQEARAAAALQHPHIIPIYDSGQYDGRYYIAMRFVDGVPLARAIPDRGLPVQRAMHIIEQIASALDYAHSRGVIHRDVSAGNVMLEAGDRVTLMDFGIAQARQGSRLTRAGVAVGTLEYLAPEQARGETATAQSDIYALGVLSYELLCGKLPFSAADDRGLLLQHLNAPPPSIRSRRPDIPVGIDAALQRCLAKDPAARFLSAAAFVTALTAALTESRRRTTAFVPPVTPVVAGPTQRPASPPRKQPAPPNPVPPPRVNTSSQVRPRLSQHRRIPRWAPVVLLLLLLAVAGAALAQRGSQAGGAAAVVSTVARTLSSGVSTLASLTTGHGGVTVAPKATATAGATATAAPIAPPVRPGLPQDAVQGFYDALNQALKSGHNTSDMAAAYVYLSPAAQFQEPLSDFLRQYANDTSVGWRWYPPTYAADQKSASVTVDVTEYRPGGNAATRIAWVATTDGTHGWHLDHVGAPAAPATTAAANDGGGQGNNGNGHGQGRNKGN